MAFLGGCTFKRRFVYVCVILVLGETIEFTRIKNSNFWTTLAAIKTISQISSLCRVDMGGLFAIGAVEFYLVSRYIHIPELQHDGHFGVSDGDRGSPRLNERPKKSSSAASRVQYTIP